MLITTGSPSQGEQGAAPWSLEGHRAGLQHVPEPVQERSCWQGTTSTQPEGRAGAAVPVSQDWAGLGCRAELDWGLWAVGGAQVSLGRATGALRPGHRGEGS